MFLVINKRDTVCIKIYYSCVRGICTYHQVEANETIHHSEGECDGVNLSECWDSEKVKALSIMFCQLVGQIFDTHFLIHSPEAHVTH